MGAKRCILRRQAEADVEQADGAVRGVGADDFLRQRRQSVPFALQVEGMAEVGRGIGQRAVEVEQYCLSLRLLFAAAMDQVVDAGVGAEGIGFGEGL